MRERKEIPGDGVIYPEREFLDSLYDLEKDVEEGSTTLRELLREVLERIIEKRLEYYLLSPQKPDEL